MIQIARFRSAIMQSHNLNFNHVSAIQSRPIFVSAFSKSNFRFILTLHSQPHFKLIHCIFFQISHAKFFRLQWGHLDVVVPPDILDDPESNGASMDEGITNEGGQIQLVCKATGVPQPTVSVTVPYAAAGWLKLYKLRRYQTMREFFKSALF